MHIILECIGPVFEFEARTMENGTHTGSDSAMWPFSKANGTGSIRESDFDFLSSVLEEMMNFGVPTKFTATIKANVASSNVPFVFGDERRDVTLWKSFLLQWVSMIM